MLYIMEYSDFFNSVEINKIISKCKKLLHLFIINETALV